MPIHLSITEVHDLDRAWKLTRSSNFKEEAESCLSHNPDADLLFAHCTYNCFITVDEAYQAVTTSFWRTFSWINKQGCKGKVSTFKSIARRLGYSDTTVNSSYALTNNPKMMFSKSMCCCNVWKKVQRK